MARVEKFDAEKKAQYVTLLRDGGRRMASARAVGVDPRTVEKHMHKYPDFAVEVSRAEMEANQQVESALYRAALAGNVTACQVWLYNRDSERWKDQRNVKVGLVRAEDLSDDQLAAIAAGSRPGTPPPAGPT